MNQMQTPRHPRWGYVMSSAAIAIAASVYVPAVSAQRLFLSLADGFTPNPTVVEGTGGGDRRAETVVNMRQTSTGPCLGYVSSEPHEEITLQANFSHLEMRVESDLDTTLIIEGPGGVWCNDDHGGKNPTISGEWLPGLYRIWVGAYRADDVPDYRLSIRDRS